MATFASIAAAGQSLERYLNACFQQDNPIPGAPRQPRAVVVRTDDFDVGAGASVITPPAVSIFLYRIELNRTMRAAWSGVASVDGRARLPLDLHYLITAWADNAEREHRLLGKVLECLEVLPSLTGPTLVPAGEWEPDEAIQLVAEELGTETLLRLFDPLPHDYKLSLGYIARVVRIDARVPAPPPEVTTAVLGIVPERAP